MSEAKTYLQKLDITNPVREPLLRAIIHDLGLPQGSQGLDAGCGIGWQSILLAEEIGPAGHVTGLDLSTSFLEHAETLVQKAGLSERIRFQNGNIQDLPFDKDSFDWVWSADCIGYPTADLPVLLEELKRVVRPGGSIIILSWSSQSLLPGYALLEARLNATCSGYENYYRGKDPDSYFSRALKWFELAGLEKAYGKSYLHNIQSPLNQEIRDGLISLLSQLWGTRQPETTDEDWAVFQSLCRPESPDFILDLPGYYGFFTYTVFCGQVPE